MSGSKPPMGPQGPSIDWSELRPRRPEDFGALYAAPPPWDIGRPQRAFVELARAGEVKGRVLDVGCGTGEHALMAAGLGLEAVGIDVVPAAIAIAQRKAADRGLSARFLVANALELTSLNERFDTVLDCGLFHIFKDDDRLRFVDSLRAVVPAGGRYYMLCFSDLQPGDSGPRRIAKSEIIASFDNAWHIDAIDPAKIDITTSADGVLAWRASITRT